MKEMVHLHFIHKAVSDSEVHKVDEVSEVTLVGEIDDNLRLIISL